MTIDGVLAGLVAVADPPSAEARGALDEMHAMGIEVAMVTGDRSGTARAIASELGIPEVVAEVKPEDKARVVFEQRAAGNWAFIYDVIGIPLAAGVFYPWTGWQLSPVVASAAMSLSSVSVLANSLRLRQFAK